MNPNEIASSALSHLSPFSQSSIIFSIELFEFLDKTSYKSFLVFSNSSSSILWSVNLARLEINLKADES